MLTGVFEEPGHKCIDFRDEFVQHVHSDLNLPELMGTIKIDGF